MINHRQYNGTEELKISSLIPLFSHFTLSKTLSYVHSITMSNRKC